MDSQDRVALVREKIGNGSLPPTPCVTLWGGPGTRAACAACERPIVPPALEFECHAEDGRVYILCQECFTIWASVVGRRDEPHPARPPLA